MRKLIYFGIAAVVLVIAGGLIVLSQFMHQATVQEVNPLQLSFNAGHPDQVQISTLEPIPADSIPSQVIQTRTQSVSGVQIQLISLQSGVWGNNVGTRAEVCYSLPTENEDWKPMAVALSVDGYMFPVQSGSLLRYETSSGVSVTWPEIATTDWAVVHKVRRCEALVFPTPNITGHAAQITIYSVKTERIEPPDCEFARKNLAALSTGILINCGGVGFSFDRTIASRPDQMSELVAAQLVQAAFMNGINGPWNLTATVD